MPSVALEPAASSLLLRLTQARIGDTLHDLAPEGLERFFTGIVQTTEG